MPDPPGMPEVVAALQAANGRLRTENEDLKAENAELRERIARLERLISRNSGNSSMPPGSDDLPGRKPPGPKARRGGGRKAGQAAQGAGGVPGWREDPDQVVPDFPRGSCACGRPGGRGRPGGAVFASGH